jgi:hypothetical protein
MVTYPVVKGGMRAFLEFLFCILSGSWFVPLWKWNTAFFAAWHRSLDPLIPLTIRRRDAFFQTAILDYQSAFVFLCDVTAHGRHFLINTVPAGGVSSAVNVVVNWQAGIGDPCN